MAGGLTPEQISAEMWAPPPTFDTSAQTSASALMSVVGQIDGILAGQQANAGALFAAWASPTGAAAVSANRPYQMWLTELASQLTAAASQILAAGAEFAGFRSVTPTPLQFIENDARYTFLMATNILGNNTVPIAINRLEYAMLCAVTWAAYGMWGGASGTMIGQLSTPLPAPPSSAVPGAAAAGAAAAAAGLTGRAPMGQAMAAVAPLASAAAAPLSSVGSVGSSVGSSSSLLSQPADLLASSGGQLAQAPSAASGLGSMASAAPSAASGLGSPTAGSGGTGANNGNWYGMPAAGGTVAAAMSGGGGAGMSGLGGAGAMAAPAMRGPGAWASTVNAAPEGNQAVLSRFEMARAASTTPATSGGMGAPGTMMPPRQASASEQEREGDRTLETAAVLYRPPRGMPVITGAAGAHFVAGEEGQ